MDVCNANSLPGFFVLENEENEHRVSPEEVGQQILGVIASDQFPVEELAADALELVLFEGYEISLVVDVQESLLIEEIVVETAEFVSENLEVIQLDFLKAANVGIQLQQLFLEEFLSLFLKEMGRGVIGIVLGLYICLGKQIVSEESEVRLVHFLDLSEVLVEVVLHYI